MNYLIENWFLIVSAVVVFCVVVMGVINIIQTPSEKNLNRIREWLLFAIVEAEKIYGSNLGMVKLRWVYDSFLVRFKWLSVIISFEMFSSLVDESLEIMKKMLESNKEMKRLVEGDKE